MSTHTIRLEAHPLDIRFSFPSAPLPPPYRLSIPSIAVPFDRLLTGRRACHTRFTIYDEDGNPTQRRRHGMAYDPITKTPRIFSLDILKRLAHATRSNRDVYQPDILRIGPAPDVDLPITDFVVFEGHPDDVRERWSEIPPLKLLLKKSAVPYAPFKWGDVCGGALSSFFTNEIAPVNCHTATAMMLEAMDLEPFNFSQLPYETPGHDTPNPLKARIQAPKGGAACPAAARA